MFKDAIETYRDVTGYTLNSLKQSEPSCFNSIINIKRYRITVEEIVESNEILCERLQKLWDHSDSQYNWEPMRVVAVYLNYELQGSPGNKRVRK